MERLGFIHEKLDIKILILFVLRRLPAPIDGEKLGDLVLIDGGIGYFDYKQCLSELVKNSQVEETEEGFVITAKGSHNCEILSDSLPYSVRSKAEKVTDPVAEEMRRSAMILANHEVSSSGVTVYLAVSDGIGSIFDLKILAASEEQAKKIERNFKANAEDYYNRFIRELSESEANK
jgi:hypothetical protein